MRTNKMLYKIMSQQNLYTNYIQMISAIEHCVENHLLLPALVMIYTSIDSVSWLANHDSAIGTGKAFKAWTAEWMLKNTQIKCSPEELYAARCGILHTLTPASDLNKKGVRKVAYSWGSAENGKLEESISRLGMDEELTSIHLESLFASFREGMANYLEHVFSDPQLKNLFLAKSNLHFANLSINRLDTFLEITDSPQV